MNQTSHPGGKVRSQHDEYLAALLRGDRLTCTHIARELLAGGLPVKSLYTDWFQASLYQIGELWERNQISVATEHLATAITERVMSEVAGPVLFGHEPTGHSLLVSCVASEFHQIGGRMVADIAELNGWDTYFLGANTPLSGLLSALAEKTPDVLALSLAIPAHLPALQSVIEAVGAEYATMPVWLGGQAFHQGWEPVGRFAQVKLLASLDEFETELARLAALPAG